MFKKLEYKSLDEILNSKGKHNDEVTRKDLERIGSKKISDNHFELIKNYVKHMNCDVDKVFNKTGVKVVTEKIQNTKTIIEELEEKYSIHTWIKHKS